MSTKAPKSYNEMRKAGIVMMLLLLLLVDIGINGTQQSVQQQGYDALIVATAGRCGSTYLMELLNSIPGVLNIGEFDNRISMPPVIVEAERERKILYMRQKLEILANKQLRETVGPERDEVIAALPAEVLEAAEFLVAKVVFFSWQGAYNLTTTDFVNLVGRLEDVAVVHLTRNPLESAISFATTWAKKKFTAQQKKSDRSAFHEASADEAEFHKRNMKKTRLSLQHVHSFHRMFEHDQQTFSAAMRACSNYIGEITYDELDGNPLQVIKWLLGHLNIPNERLDAVNTGTMCKGSSAVRLEDRYANSDELKRYIIRHGDFELWNYLNRVPLKRNCTYSSGLNTLRDVQRDLQNVKLRLRPKEKPSLLL